MYVVIVICVSDPKIQTLELVSSQKEETTVSYEWRLQGTYGIGI